MTSFAPCQRQNSLGKLIVAVVLFASCRTTSTTPQYDIQPRVAAAHQLMTREDIARAMDFVDHDRESIMSDWRTLAEIPAPSGSEQNRAAFVRKLLEESGLTVETDGAGNVIATRKGTGGGKRIVFDAHLDTVFAATTNIKTRIENGRIYGPGVGDDTRNVAALLAMIRAMNAANIQTRGDIIFLFTVEEETTFRGINQFLADRAKTIDDFVALDGGYSDFTFGGIGIYWDRYHVIGPGGHTRSSAEIKSATLPVARAIERLYRMRVPKTSWLNVGMLGGADVFNAKAADAWMSVDLRSTDAATLHRLDKQIESIVRAEAQRSGMQMRREVVSKSEPALLPNHRTSPLVLTTEGVWRAFGFNPLITDTASNHSSAALLAGVPAIGTGTAPCRASHSLDESCEVEPIFTGVKRNVVLAVALAE